MAGDKTTDNVLASGPRGRVEYAIGKGGTCDAKAWLESQSNKTVSSFSVLFKKLAAQGFIRNKTQFRPYTSLDGVFEFKRGGNRLFCRQHGRRWILTHHYGKGGGDQTTSAKRTIAISDQFLQRERESVDKKGAE